MAGGKATRFETSVEKGLLTVGRRTLLERALEALSVEGLSEVLVATSPHTPRTKVKAEELGVEVITTPGTGYHEDIMELLMAYSSFVTLNVDIPFVQKAHVTSLLEAFDGRSLAAILPISIARTAQVRASLARDGTGGRFIWVGLNIVTPEPDTMTLELDDPLLAVNINDESDLIRANSIALDKNL